ncbi:MAG: rhomboid family intramembrane serine protease [Gammaproteobacteria bacterium]|nr:rhomboid family intramembrane serine protease [Gammaproteobacteria bacterium]
MSVSQPFGTEAWVVVLEGRDPRQADEAIFVLRAIGIEHALTRLDRTWQLSVPAASASRASTELAAYRAEMQADPRHGRINIEEIGHGWYGVVAYVCVLLVAAIASNQDLLGYDWLGTGRLDVDRVMAGEWWRTVTALCLHADLGHLGGNIAFGGFFGLFAGRYLGSGIAWLGILMGGLLGNALNALIQPSGHLAIGASTAVFAALGMLAAYTWRRGFFKQTSWKTRAAPVTAAIGLLAFVGTGGGGEGGNVDIIAHLTGFIAGFSVGVLLALRKPPSDGRIQTYTGTVAAGIIAVAWIWGSVAS